MYKSEGPISKTNKPPDRTASNNEEGRGVDEILSFFVRDPSGDRFLPAVKHAATRIEPLGRRAGLRIAAAADA